MFKSKGFIMLIIILAICLILISFHIMSNNNMESDSNEQDNSNDTIMMPIQDENGSVRLVPVTDTTSEGSASGP
ncbi:hypothetical protein [Methanobrevibacter sp. V74]|uniref:hypothetical protein n=1 Tax=Methanobrevibacter sp. V74 TaxID=3064279 RepID=UPI0027324871|nr:hypothetical protein [Methanobrevibacter sp. V74]